MSCLAWRITPLYCRLVWAAKSWVVSVWALVLTLTASEIRRAKVLPPVHRSSLPTSTTNLRILKSTGRWKAARSFARATQTITKSTLISPTRWASSRTLQLTTARTLRNHFKRSRLGSIAVTPPTSIQALPILRPTLKYGRAKRPALSSLMFSSGV